MSQLSENSPANSHQLTSLGLFFSLFSGQWRPGEFWNKRSFRRKFMLRSLLVRQPRLPVRLHRPYLAVNFSRSQVLEALRYHYTLLSEAMSSEELSAYLNTQALLLAKVEGKNGDIFTFELTMQVNLDKEGDSTILMRNSDGDVLAEMTFSILAYEGQRTLFIGGLQGGRSDLPHEAIQTATKSCHGLFPKRLVMEAVCRFAERLQAEQILAVSNEAHIFRGERYQDKNKKILSDYDTFWAAVGGECDKLGYFHLPTQIARKDESEIASKKRAEYRRRYQLLDEIQTQMSTLFAPH